MQRISIFIALLVIFIFGEACGATPTQDVTSQSDKSALMIMEPWGRASLVDGGNSAIYLNIMNHGEVDDVLLRASTDVAEATELHETTMDENDVMNMSPINNIAVPADSIVSLEPGGKHIMLLGLTETLHAGTPVKVTLTFEKAGEIVVEAEVREMGGMDHNDGQNGDHGNMEQGEDEG